MTNGNSRFIEFTLALLGVIITYSASQFPGYDTYAWAGGVFTFIMFAILFADAFQWNGLASLWISSLITGLLMMKIYPFFGVIMILAFIIGLFFVLALIDEYQRRGSW